MSEIAAGSDHGQSAPAFDVKDAPPAGRNPTVLDVKAEPSVAAHGSIHAASEIQRVHVDERPAINAV